MQFGPVVETLGAIALLITTVISVVQSVGKKNWKAAWRHTETGLQTMSVAVDLMGKGPQAEKLKARIRKISKELNQNKDAMADVAEQTTLLLKQFGVDTSGATQDEQVQMLRAVAAVKAAEKVRSAKPVAAARKTGVVGLFLGL